MHRVRVSGGISNSAAMSAKDATSRAARSSASRATTWLATYRASRKVQVAATMRARRPTEAPAGYAGRMAASIVANSCRRLFTPGGTAAVTILRVSAALWPGAWLARSRTAVARASRRGGNQTGRRFNSNFLSSRANLGESAQNLAVLNDRPKPRRRAQRNPIVASSCSCRQRTHVVLPAGRAPPPVLSRV